MSNLYLKFPTLEDKCNVWDYRQEFLSNGEMHISGSGNIEDFGSYEEWLRKVEKEVDIETCGEGRVPCTQYLTYRYGDNKLVGMLQIRHDLNDYLLKFGGHIGDSVRPSERNKGYATEQIALALKKCKSLKIKNVLITCRKSNKASARTIIKNNGVFENELPYEEEFMQRYWIELEK